jgi:uncharacterized phage protein gp47/JayE
MQVAEAVEMWCARPYFHGNDYKLVSWAVEVLRVPFLELKSVQYRIYAVVFSA